MSDPPEIPGFTRCRLPGAGVEIDALVGGSGPPLLLLHGYPQTRRCWRSVAPELAKRFTVVCPDLRGYGRSDQPTTAADPEAYSKRRMAEDQIATMGALGFNQFSVAGHDRGGRVAYRLALDHPKAVRRLAVLDLIPTGEMWRRMDGAQAMGAFHWTFLAQPGGLPESLIGGDPEGFLRALMRRWAAPGACFEAAAMEDYVRHFSRPETIRATCEDYRAGWAFDRVHDEADRGVRWIEGPVLALWGDALGQGGGGVLDVWRGWARDVDGWALPCGHFLPEEAPGDVANALLSFCAEEH